MNPHDCAPRRTLAVTAAAVAHSRSAGVLCPIAAVRNDLREGPHSTGRSRLRSRPSDASAAKECSARFGKSKSRIDDDRVTRDTRVHRPANRLCSSRLNFRGYVRDSSFPIHVARPSAIVHEHDRRAVSRPRRAGRSRRTRNPLMSLTIAAPRAIASRATTAL